MARARPRNSRSQPVWSRALALLPVFLSPAARAANPEESLWGLILDSVGIPLLLAMALTIVLLIVLYRKLYLEIDKRQICEVATEVERDRLNAILDEAGVGVQIIDRRFNIVDVNHQWRRMFGLRRREVRGHLKAADRIFGPDVDAMNTRFRDVLAGTVARKTRQCRFLRRDGQVFWGLISLSPVEARDGSIKWVVAMIADIDAQKRAEQALRESEERLRFITDNTRDVVWQLDAEMRFVFVNGADRRLRGFSKEKVIGESFRSQIVESSLPAFDAAIQEHTGPFSQAIHFEVEVHCHDRPSLWMEVNSTAIHGADGEITGYIGVSRDVTALRRQQRLLQEQAIRDPLTGLYNRRFLDESLARELARARSENAPLALIMIDIDHFKQLNDTYGHPAGDEVIRQLARLLQRGARSGDYVCRYGGEEFLLVLPAMSLANAAARTDAWRSAFAALDVALGERTVHVTFSAGVAEYPRHGEAADRLIQIADQALYAAKNAGRNRVAAAG